MGLISLQSDELLSGKFIYTYCCKFRILSLIFINVIMYSTSGYYLRHKLSITLPESV